MDGQMTCSRYQVRLQLRLSALLALLLNIQTGFHCNRLKWQPGDLMVERRIMNDLSNYRIASLSHIVETNFTHYAEVESQELTYVLYKKGAEKPLQMQIEENPMFMRCERSNYHNPPWSYICIKHNHNDWDLETSKRDVKELKTCQCSNDIETMELTFRVKGRTKSGQKASDIYMLKLDMVSRCVYEKEHYQDLKLTCMWKTEPYMDLLSYRIRGSDPKTFYVFDIPQNNWNRTIKVENLIFTNGNPEKDFFVDLYCDNSFLSSLFINGTERYFDVNEVCQGPSKVIRFQPRERGAINTLADGSIQMGYYIMEEFCNKRCIDKYCKWSKIIDRLPSQCVSDKLQLDVAFKECDVQYNLTLNSPTVELNYGGNVTFFCDPTSIILPYHVNWEKIGSKDEATKSWLTNTNSHTIRNLSYAHEGDYQCDLVTEGGKPQRKSNIFRLKLHNVFLGQLKFQIPLEGRNASNIFDMKSDIERNVTKALNEKNVKQSIHPRFNIDVENGLTLEGDNILIIGSLKSVKTDRLPTYVKWVKEVNDVIKEEFSSVYIKILNEGACNSVTERWDSLRVTYTWPITGADMVEQQPCPFNETYFAYKRCAPGTNGKPARYEPTNHTACSSVDGALADLHSTNITTANAVAKSHELLNVISRGVNITSYQLTSVADTLVRFRELVNVTDGVINNVMDTIDNVMDLDEGVLVSSEKEGQSTSRIIELLGNIAEDLSTSSPYTVSKKNFALRGTQRSVDDFDGISINVIYGASGVVISSEKDEEEKSDDVSKIVVRRAAKKQLPASENVTFVTISYKDDRLFVRSSNTTSSNNFTVNSHVISTEIRGHTIKNLPSAVTLTFSLQNTSIMAHDKMCTFWNFTTNDWSDAGCRVAGIDDISKTVTCTCDHMTNFAVMFSAIPPEGIHCIILSYITYIGLSISLAGVFLTLLTFTLFPMLRTSTPPKVLMNLCVALIGMYIVFLISTGTPPGTSGCKAVSIFLQYFFLAVFSWSAIEGFHSSRNIVTPMSVEINSFLQKALIFGWGAPVLITGIGAGVWSDHYGTSDYCIVRNHPFFYTVLIPILVVVIFNLTCVCAIGVVLMSSSKKYKSSSMSMRNRVRILAGFVVLFGVTWIMGFFVVSNDVIAFQYAFCFMCCVQGIYIFLLYGIKKGKQRRCWHKLLSGKSIAEIHRHFLLKSQGGSTRRGSGGVFSRAVSTTSGGMGTSSAQLTSCNSLCHDKKLTSSRDLLNEVKKTAASTVRIELKRKPESESQETHECPPEPHLHRNESLVGTIVRKFEEMRQKSISEEKVNRPLLQRGAQSLDWEDGRHDSCDSGRGLGDTTSSSNETNNESVFPLEPIPPGEQTALKSCSDSTQGLLGAQMSSIDTDEGVVFPQNTSSPVERGKSKVLQRQRHFSEV